MNIYQQNIIQHYQHPENSGRPVKFTHKMLLQNTSCGDETVIYLTIENNVVTDIHHETEGCSIAIATASILSDELKGKTVAEINAMNEQDVMSLIGIQLTTARVKCAHLSLEAIQLAAKSAENQQ